MAYTTAEKAFPTKINGATPAVRFPAKARHRRSLSKSWRGFGTNGRILVVLDAIQWALLPFGAVLLFAYMVRAEALIGSDLLIGSAAAVLTFGLAVLVRVANGIVPFQANDRTQGSVTKAADQGTGPSGT